QRQARGPLPARTRGGPWPRVGLGARRGRLRRARVAQPRAAPPVSPHPQRSLLLNPRVLILSWEYPPIVEGGLARHVRKLSEPLVKQGTEVHVLTRGGGHRPAEEVRHGVTVHRVAEPDFPKNDLDAFIAWVERMNRDLAAA